jgi:anti-sigma regulatory factor (Ser/Thr protein kinase)
MTLPPGTTVCLYTDGLVGPRGRTRRAGIERLCRTVFAGAPDVVCSVVLADLIGDRPTEDDVAVLVVRRPTVERTEPLTLRMPAQPACLQPVRAATRRWLAAVGQTPVAAGDLLVAVGEAVANVVEHAYGPRGGDVYLHLAVEASDVVAVVRDTGRWRAPRGQHRGRGSTLMAELSDEVSIDRTDGGTRVVIRRALDGSRS